MATFRDRFNELCEGFPNSDTTLASSIGVSKQTISAWRLGERSPKKPTIAIIAQFFDVSIAWLCGITDIKEKYEAPAIQSADADNDSVNQEILSILRSFSEDEKLRALDYLRYISSRKEK